MITIIGNAVICFMIFALIPETVFLNLGYESRFITGPVVFGFWILTSILIYIFYKISLYSLNLIIKKNNKSIQNSIVIIDKKNLLCLILLSIFGIMLIWYGLSSPLLENVGYFQTT